MVTEPTMYVEHECGCREDRHTGLPIRKCPEHDTRESRTKVAAALQETAAHLDDAADKARAVPGLFAFAGDLHGAAVALVKAAKAILGVLLLVALVGCRREQHAEIDAGPRQSRQGGRPNCTLAHWEVQAFNKATGPGYAATISLRDVYGGYQVHAWSESGSVCEVLIELRPSPEAPWYPVARIANPAPFGSPEENGWMLPEPAAGDELRLSITGYVAGEVSAAAYGRVCLGPAITRRVTTAVEP